MVACDMCDDWLHVNFINYSTGLATVAITYVCQRYIHDNFLVAINFLHYQIKKKAWNDYEIKNTIVFYQNLALEETLTFQSHNFISDSCNLSKKVTVHSHQGIKNEYFNCWFSATMQVLLETMIQELLVKTVHSDDPMTLQSLITFSAKLKSQLIYRNNNIRLSSDEVSISELCGIDIKSGIFCDPVEFLELFIEKTNTRALFDTKQIQILRCEGCDNLNGDIGRDSPVIKIDIPEVTCELVTNEILWNTATGPCIALAESRPCQSCSVGDEININCTRRFTFFMQCPIFLILKFNRVQHENFAKVFKGKIKLFKELNINLLTPRFQTSEQSKYQLIANINSSRDSSTRSNHFIVALFDYENQKAFVFNDDKIKRYYINKKLQEEDFQTTLYVAFFVRKECVIEELYSKAHPWFLKEAEITSTENLYFNDRNSISTRITRHDILSTSGQNHFNDTIMIRFIQSQYKNVNGAISTTSYLIPPIAQDHFNNEYQTITAECDFTDTNLIVIPYNQEGNVGHWSTFAIYPKKYSMFYLDSKKTVDLCAFNCALHLLKKCFESK